MLPDDDNVAPSGWPQGYGGVGEPAAVPRGQSAIPDTLSTLRERFNRPVDPATPIDKLTDEDRMCILIQSGEEIDFEYPNDTTIVVKSRYPVGFVSIDGKLRLFRLSDELKRQMDSDKSSFPTLRLRD